MDLRQRYVFSEGQDMKNVAYSLKSVTFPRNPIILFSFHLMNEGVEGMNSFFVIATI